MINKELSKRIITSVFLLVNLVLIFFFTYILIISLIIISVISWIEFKALISKIFNKKKFKTKFLNLLIKGLSLIYLCLFSLIVFNSITYSNSHLIIFLFLICICSDTGGLIFGKLFKGKKLTKISPNKTISGSIGSFILTMILVPIFHYLFQKVYDPLELSILAIIVSFACQLGDLFISFLKRKAKVKNTGDLLPGHGGVLDRIDGLLLAIPVGIILSCFLKSI